MATRKWNVYQGNGSVWLGLDCERADDEVANYRWSGSERFRRLVLRVDSSGTSYGE